MSLADFSTVKANSAASGELCLALQQMQTGEDTKGREVWGGEGGNRWSPEALSHSNSSTCR